MWHTRGTVALEALGEQVSLADQDQDQLSLLLRINFKHDAANDMTRYSVAYNGGVRKDSSWPRIYHVE